jgi:hypothetical protein
MFDTTAEQPLPLAILAREVPNRRGKRGINCATVWRWTMKDNKYGVRLESVVIGGVRMSSREALARYIERTTAAANGEPVPVRTSRQREAAIRAAERELEASR